MTSKRRPRRRVPVRKARSRGGAATGLLIALLLLIAGAGWVVWTYAGPGPAKAPVTSVLVERGSGLAGIADQLAEAGVIRSKPIFMFAAKLRGDTLKAGEYEIRAGASMARVLSDLSAGRVVRHLITIPEGWTSGMAADAVARSAILTGPVAAPAEGTLLPETYEIQRGESRAAVLQRMVDAQAKLMAKAWPSRQAGLPFTTQREALILASIVEKETAVAAERPRVAAVYVNRLRLGMRLESDPTTIYGITQGRPLGRGITRSELAAVTPYNTYQIAGLPPTPIANPGRASIEAVLNPPKTDEIFFVADGSGGHAFATNYADHQANVARWRSIERQRQGAQAGAAALPGSGG